MIRFRSCGGAEEDYVTNPRPPHIQQPSAWVIVLSAESACLNGATVKLWRAGAWVRAWSRTARGVTLATMAASPQRTGETITQEPCGVWDYSGGFELKNLTPGVDMNSPCIRARVSHLGLCDYSCCPDA